MPRARHEHRAALEATPKDVSNAVEGTITTEEFGEQGARLSREVMHRKFFRAKKKAMMTEPDMNISTRSNAEGR